MFFALLLTSSFVLLAIVRVAATSDLISSLYCLVRRIFSRSASSSSRLSAASLRRPSASATFAAWLSLISASFFCPSSRFFDTVSYRSSTDRKSDCSAVSWDCAAWRRMPASSLDFSDAFRASLCSSSSSLTRSLVCRSCSFSVARRRPISFPCIMFEMPSSALPAGGVPSSAVASLAMLYCCLVVAALFPPRSPNVRCTSLDSVVGLDAVLRYSRSDCTSYA